jgi:hypothetical protein
VEECVAGAGAGEGVVVAVAAGVINQSFLMFLVA